MQQPLNAPLKSSPVLSGFDVVLLLLLIPWIVSLLSRRKMGQLDVPGAWPLLFWLTANLLAFAAAGCPPAGQIEIVRTTASAMLFLLVACGFTRKSPAPAAGLALLVIGLWMAVQLLWLVGLPTLQLGRMARPVGSYVMIENNFLLTASMIILAARLFQPQKWYVRVVEIIALALMGMSIAMSLQRAAYLAVGAGLLVLARVPRHRTARLLLVVGLAAVVAGVVLAELPLGLGFNPQSAPLRIGAWTAALGALQSAPLLGIGPGRFMYEYSTFLPPDMPARYAYMCAHNSFLQIAAQTGLLGLSAFLVFLFAILRRLVETASRLPPEGAAQALGATGAICAVVVMMVFHESPTWMAIPMSTIWIVFAYGAAVAAEYPRVAAGDTDCKP